MKNNAQSIEQHLKKDKRLIAANKEIDFLQRFEGEVVDEKKVVAYGDISIDLLELTPGTLIFKVIKTSASPKELMDREEQEVGKSYRFEFSDLLDKEKNLTLDVYVYNTEIGYFYARDEFLNMLGASSMSFIPFKKGPADLGTASFKMKEIYPFGQLIWVYRNLYFRISNANLSEEAVLKVAYWAQEQVKHPNE